MKKKIFNGFIIVLLLITFVGGLVALTRPAPDDQALEPIEEYTYSEDITIGDAQYRITYEVIGGTPENPIYQMVIEVIGDEPLIIEGGSILGSG